MATGSRTGREGKGREGKGIYQPRIINGSWAVL
jgi:hypothetical protein